MNDPYMLEIDWEKGTDLPRMVGPFKGEIEARQWAKLNARRADWTIHQLAYPYLRDIDGNDVSFVDWQS